MLSRSLHLAGRACRIRGQLAGQKKAVVISPACGGTRNLRRRRTGLLSRANPSNASRPCSKKTILLIRAGLVFSWRPACMHACCCMAQSLYDRMIKGCKISANCDTSWKHANDPCSCRTIFSQKAARTEKTSEAYFGDASEPGSSHQQAVDSIFDVQLRDEEVLDSLDQAGHLQAICQSQNSACVAVGEADLQEA